MRKRNHNRNDSSGDNTNSGKNSHLSDEQLLLALDGELSSREAAKVTLHLEACWSCRVRSQQIEKVIADILEYRDSLIKPYLPLSTGSLESFVVRLERLARTVGQSSLRSHVAGKIRLLQAFLQGVVPRHVWVSALVIGSFALFLFVRLWHSPKVSASLLLENSRDFEVQRIRSVTKPVVYQKLHIRIGAKAVTRTIYRDSIGMRQVEHVDATGSSSLIQTGSHLDDPIRGAESELQRTFLAAHLNWQDPLSPATYSSWHDGLRQKQDDITATNQDLLTLKTATTEGSITEARITFRAKDFHPVEEELRLRDAREVEIEEMAWDVLPMEVVNPAIFSRESTAYGEIERPTSLPLPPQGPSNAQLAEAELRGRVALHIAGADLGEQIELDRSTSSPSQHSVIVRGIVSTLERKSNLLVILQGIPHVEFRLQTLDEAKAQEKPFPVVRPEDANFLNAQGAAEPKSQIQDRNTLSNGSEAPAVGRAMVELLLEERFPKSEDRIAFTNRAVEFAQGAIAQAWAIRRLSDRYTPDAVAELSRGSQQTLGLLVRDHVSLLRQHLDSERDLVSPLFPPGPMDEAPGLLVSEAPGSPATLTSDWHNAVTEIFFETQRVCDSAVMLFANAGDSHRETPAVVHDLQVDLAKLQAQLPALYELVSGPGSLMPSSGARDEPY